MSDRDMVIRASQWVQPDGKVIYGVNTMKHPDFPEVAEVTRM
jgi:hypothetical protein